MDRFAALLRGVNVGGRNRVPMAQLRVLLEEQGFGRVATYIASGNAVFDSAVGAAEAAELIERALQLRFALDGGPVRVLVLPRPRLQAIVDDRPAGFGDEPARYHSDAIFLMGVDAAEALAAFDPRPGVDAVWAGDGVIYSRRLSAERTRSRLSKAMSSPLYKSMTIRSWATTTAILELLRAGEG